MGSSWDYEPEETEAELEERVKIAQLKLEYRKLMNILVDAPLAALTVRQLQLIQQPECSPYSYFYTQDRINALLAIVKQLGPV